jgi:hypothetical protein
MISASYGVDSLSRKKAPLEDRGRSSVRCASAFLAQVQPCGIQCSVSSATASRIRPCSSPARRSLPSPRAACATSHHHVFPWRADNRRACHRDGVARSPAFVSGALMFVPLAAVGVRKIGLRVRKNMASEFQGAAQMMESMQETAQASGSSRRSRSRVSCAPAKAPRSKALRRRRAHQPDHGKLRARLRLAFFFKKRKYLKYEEFSFFSARRKAERQRFTRYNRDTMNIGVVLDGGLISKHPELLYGWPAEVSPPSQVTDRPNGVSVAVVAHIYYEDTWPDIAGAPGPDDSLRPNRHDCCRPRAANRNNTTQLSSRGN